MLNFVEDEPWVVNSSTDEIGRCVHLDGNWTTLTGQTQSEALGHGWLDVLYPDDRVPTIEELSKALKKRIGFRHEFRIRRRDGRLSMGARGRRAARRSDRLSRVLRFNRRHPREPPRPGSRSGSGREIAARARRRENGNVRLAHRG